MPSLPYIPFSQFSAPPPKKKETKKKETAERRLGLKKPEGSKIIVLLSFNKTDVNTHPMSSRHVKRVI